jgi:hypothetical protein
MEPAPALRSFLLVADRQGRLGCLELKLAAMVPRGALAVDPRGSAVGSPLDMGEAAIWLNVRDAEDELEDMLEGVGEGDVELPTSEEPDYYEVFIAGAASEALERAVLAGVIERVTDHGYVTRAPMAAAALRVHLVGTRVIAVEAGSQSQYRFWESIYVWQQDDPHTYHRDGEGGVKITDERLPPAMRSVLAGVARLEVDFAGLGALRLGECCEPEEVVAAFPGGVEGDEVAVRARFEAHRAACRDLQACTRPDALFRIGSRPWVPDRMVAVGAVLRTDRLATWFPDYDLMISDWKSRRQYVDARDVTKETDPRHPANLLTERHPHLRRLVEAMPIFALGDDHGERGPGSGAWWRARGARVYTVEFIRTAEDFFLASAEGPGLDRSVSGPLFAIEDATAGAYGGGRERRRDDLIERILLAVSDGRVDPRAMYVAELWAALAGGPSLMVFAPEERAQYIDMQEAALAEVVARAAVHGHIVDELIACYQAAEARGEREFMLPYFDWGQIEHQDAVTLRNGNDKDNDVVVAIDGASEITLPARRQWVLDRDPKAWIPEVERVWIEAAFRRHAERRKAAPRSDPTRTLGAVAFVLVALVVVGVLVAVSRGGVRW